jgi:UPF0755 protein
VSVEELQQVLDSGRLEPQYRPAGTDSWEGLLLPGTYQLRPDSEAIDVLAQMNDEFALVTEDLGYGTGDTPLGLSPYEVVIVASMVEAEVEVDGDRPKVARVIYNRLQEQLSLDITSTCIYGSGDRYIDLTQAYMMEDAGAYACRLNSALPPTPIATPSVASLHAAINPAPNPVTEDGVERPWLYYVVADAEGGYFFTDDYEEFLQQQYLSAEQGLL